MPDAGAAQSMAQQYVLFQGIDRRENIAVSLHVDAQGYDVPKAGSRQSVSAKARSDLGCTVRDCPLSANANVCSGSMVRGCLPTSLSVCTNSMWNAQQRSSHKLN